MQHIQHGSIQCPTICMCCDVRWKGRAPAAAAGQKAAPPQADRTPLWRRQRRRRCRQTGAEPPDAAAAARHRWCRPASKVPPASDISHTSTGCCYMCCVLPACQHVYVTSCEANDDLTCAMLRSLPAARDSSATSGYASCRLPQWLLSGCVNHVSNHAAWTQVQAAPAIMTCEDRECWGSGHSPHPCRAVSGMPALPAGVLRHALHHSSQASAQLCLQSHLPGSMNA
jgi:hypothetical protein